MKSDRIWVWLMGLGIGLVVAGSLVLVIGIELIKDNMDIMLGANVAVAKAETTDNTLDIPDIPATDEIVTDEIVTDEIANDEMQQEPSEVPQIAEVEMLEITPIEVFIPKDSDSLTIAIMLEQKNIIDDANKFNEYVESMGKTRVLQQGELSFLPELEYTEVLDILLRRDSE
ncbi:MAG: hypothetical protein BEN19_05170 [Epulopiscium sp. Nuni2H_MBin003]|nr:MAG: hypothetical protein BEN19_05170 [Epulopiscium sp. Nuni2H_MBin003]